jgi:hypothetical protein
MPPTINTDEISDEQKKTGKFKLAYQQMYAQLTAPGFAHAVCCHEAGHLFYFTKVGMKNYNSFPARLYYEPTIDDYAGTMASVQPCDLKAPTAGNEANEWLWTVLKAHAAGGVIARRVMSSLPDHGDEDDKVRFMDMCKLMRVTEDPDKLWKQAQEAVSKDFSDNPKVLVALEKFAEEELRSQLGLG